MLSLKTKETIELKSAPGVTVTARILSRSAVMRRDMGTIDARRRQAIAFAKRAEIFTPPKSDAKTETEKAAAAKEREEKFNALSFEDQLAYGALTDQLVAIGDLEIRPAAIRAGIAEITGFKVDGETGTLDQLIEHGSEETLQEVYDICEARAGLQEDVAKNSQSPTTLPGPVAGENPSTTAASASA